MPQLMDPEELYEYLTQEFSQFARDLDAEQQTDLDGLLWKLSRKIPEREPQHNPV